MTGLPQGWTLATLADLGDWSSGGTPSRSNSNYFGGDIPFVKTGDLRDETLTEVEETLSASGLANSSAKIFPAGTLLIAMYGATIGRTARLAFNAATNQACAALLENEANADSMDFVWKYLRSQTETLKAAGKGGAQPNISQTVLKEYPIPLPPLPEQRRIVRKLDTLSARSTTARTHLTAIEKLVERYRKAVTERLFEELLAEHGEQELGELCERITKGASPNWQGFEYAKEGIVFVRSQNVLWRALDLTDTAFLPPAFNDKQRNSVIKENDVLLNIVGASIGRSAVATSAISGANCNQAVAVIRLKAPTPSDARYLSQWLTSPAAQAQITENAVDVARANFSLSQAKQLKLPWPPEEIRVDTLAKIETAFAKIDRLAAEAANALKLLGHLDQRILAKAFAGDLVPQDPTDEPAETLLARLREARAAAPKGKRRRTATTG